MRKSHKQRQAEKLDRFWAPLPFLADYTHDPAKASIAKVLARAAELRRGVAA